MRACMQEILGGNPNWRFDITLNFLQNDHIRMKSSFSNTLLIELNRLIGR